MILLARDQQIWITGQSTGPVNRGWTEDQIAIMFSFISHPQCLVRPVLPHRHKWLLLWPSFGRNSPIQSLLASDWQVWLILTHIHTEKSSWVLDSSISLALSRSPGTAQALTFFPCKFLQFWHHRAVSPVPNLWCLIPSWAKPVRAIILILAAAKCKNPLNHAVLFCYNGNLKLNTSNLFQPFYLCRGPIVRPDLWMVQLPGLYFIVGKGRRRKICLWEGLSEHCDDTNTSEVKV